MFPGPLRVPPGPPRAALNAGRSRAVFELLAGRGRAPGRPTGRINGIPAEWGSSGERAARWVVSATSGREQRQAARGLFRARMRVDGAQPEPFRRTSSQNAQGGGSVVSGGAARHATSTSFAPGNPQVAHGKLMEDPRQARAVTTAICRTRKFTVDQEGRLVHAQNAPTPSVPRQAAVSVRGPNAGGPGGSASAARRRSPRSTRRALDAPASTQPSSS